jgi:hypothetical protein
MLESHHLLKEIFCSRGNRLKVGKSGYFPTKHISKKLNIKGNANEIFK